MNSKSHDIVEVMGPGLKSALLLAFGIVLFGCSQVFLNPYHSVEEGPRAKFNFIAPSLQSSSFGNTDLNLRISRVLPNCELESLGMIGLEPHKRETSTYIRANQYLVLTIGYSQSGPIERTGGVGLVFLPDANTEYTLEHINERGRFTWDFWEGSVGLSTIIAREPHARWTSELKSKLISMGGCGTLLQDTSELFNL